MDKGLVLSDSTMRPLECNSPGQRGVRLVNNDQSNDDGQHECYEIPAIWRIRILFFGESCVRMDCKQLTLSISR